VFLSFAQQTAATLKHCPCGGRLCTYAGNHTTAVYSCENFHNPLQHHVLYSAGHLITPPDTPTQAVMPFVYIRNLRAHGTTCADSYTHVCIIQNALGSMRIIVVTCSTYINRVIAEIKMLNTNLPSFSLFAYLNALLVSVSGHCRHLNAFIVCFLARTTAHRGGSQLITTQQYTVRPVQISEPR
jgi:hypothetical protein